jgi:hypothetical protein
MPKLSDNQVGDRRHAATRRRQGPRRPHKRKSCTVFAYERPLCAMSGHSITAHDANRECCAAQGAAQPRKITQPNRSDRKASRFGASFRFSMRLATMRLVTPAKVKPRCPWPNAWIRFG